MYAAGRPHLALELDDRAVEYVDQRAGPELVGHRGHVLHALRFAKSAYEASALCAGAADQSPLGKDHRPGNHAEGDQDEEHNFGDRAGLQNKIDDFAAGKKSQGRKKNA